MFFRFVGLLCLPFFPLVVALAWALTDEPLRDCAADTWRGWRWLYWDPKEY